MLLYYNVASL